MATKVFPPKNIFITDIFPGYYGHFSAPVQCDKPRMQIFAHTGNQVRGDKRRGGVSLGHATQLSPHLSHHIQTKIVQNKIWNILYKYLNIKGKDCYNFYADIFYNIM